ncbi:MAG: PRTRC system protein B [bacterium]|nr:PRTRC system protein B [bacterium]
MPVLDPPDLPAMPEEIVPRAAFLLYECAGRLIATAHPLKATRSGQAGIGAGHPLTHRELRGWLSELAGQARLARARVLPPEVLAEDEDFVAWWRPARRAPIWFAGQGRQHGFRVPWPPLVFVAARGALWCAAPPKNARPGAGAPLCHAPLMNVDARGQVCLGSAEVPPDRDPHHRRAWEAAVCETNFTHVNHGRTLAPGGGGETSTEAHFAFWQNLDGQARFPMAALAPRHQTLQAWLEGIAR